MRIISALSGAALLIASAGAAAAASDPTGVWVNDTGRGAVEIKPCGKALCGHVVWVKDTSDTKGCGKQIIGEAMPAGAGRWDNGWIYSPEKRKNYDVELTPLKDGTLQVVGYAGVKFLSKTMIWTRAPADLKRCGGEVDAKAAPAASAPANAPASTPPPASPSPSATTTDAAAKSAPAPSATVASTPPADQKPAAVKATADAQPKDAQPKDEPAPSKSADADANDKADDQADDGDGGEKPGQRKSGSGIKLGDIDFDKVLTKTKSGKCKLDLPWLKVQFDCEKD